jgi:uncharacterized cupredoxin-like copper-binding protein
MFNRVKWKLVSIKFTCEKTERSMKRFFGWAMLIIVYLAMLVACASSNENVTPVSTLSVEMSEFKFTPTAMVVFAGREITLNLSNKGAVEHEFSILKKGASAQIPFDREKQAVDILFTYKLGANKTGIFKFSLPEAGEYPVICAIQGHMEAGMVATLTAK